MKRLRGSTQATLHPLAIIMTAAHTATVSRMAKGNIVAVILSPLCFLY